MATLWGDVLSTYGAEMDETWTHPTCKIDLAGEARLRDPPSFRVGGGKKMEKGPPIRNCPAEGRSPPIQQNREWRMCLLQYRTRDQGLYTHSPHPNWATKRERRKCFRPGDSCGFRMVTSAGISLESLEQQNLLGEARASSFKQYPSGSTSAGS